jgi:signal transduction histidine kinase
MRNVLSKMLILNLGITFFTMLFLSLVLLLLFSHYFYQKNEAFLEETVQEAKSLIIKYQRKEIKENSFKRGMELIDRIEGIHFYVLDASGKILFETIAENKYAPTEDVLNDIMQNTKGGKMFTAVFSDPKKPSLDILVSSVNVPGGTVLGYYLVADIMEPFRESFRLIWMTVVGAFVITIIPTYFVSRHFTRPLMEMSRAAYKIEQGDFGVRVNLVRHDEIGRLAQALNSMASQLENIEKERHDFLATVSHELRTPLTSIRGFVQGILDGAIPLANQAVYLARVYKETSRLSHIVDDLLTFARLRSERFNFNWEEADPVEALTASVEILSPLAAEKRIALNFSVKGENQIIYADIGRIMQVFINVIENAIKFSPEDKEIIIDAKWQPSGFLVRIMDEGHGIPPEELPYIFDRFYAGSFSSEREYPSIGLGLAICRLLVKKHGGEITVSNRPEGGCEFVIFLPKRRT